MSTEGNGRSDDGISIGEIAENLSQTSIWLSFIAFLSNFNNILYDARNRMFGDTFSRIILGIKSFRQSFYIFMYSRIIQAPAFILIILLLISAVSGNLAKDFQQQINGDVEVYLSLIHI